MRRRHFPNPLDEEIIEVEGPGGLTIRLNPKPEFVRTYAEYSVLFGSVDRHLPRGGGALPSGLAHFLEHGLFQNEEGDVSDRFARLGAAPNARTGYVQTSYHFTTSDEVEECLRLLLGFVCSPWFTAEMVEKERRIIEQEIRMYDDDPDWSGWLRLLESLYHVHPVRDDICGTVESLRKVTPELLTETHNVFYAPKNAILAISGACDPSQVIAVVEEMLGDRDLGKPLTRPACPEPDEIVCSRSDIRLSVSSPRIYLGFKDRAADGTPLERERREIATQLALRLALGSTSRTYEELYEAGLIDDSFSCGYYAEDGFALTSISGDTEQPEVLHERVLSAIERTVKDGFTDVEVERVRRRALGRLVRAFDSPETVGSTLATCERREVAPFAILDILRDLDGNEILSCLSEHCRPERSALVVTRPR